MPKIDIDSAPRGDGTTYPEEFADPCKPRRRWKLGDAAGLDQFGVNMLRRPAGAWSSQRHWHALEDEFIYVLEGELVLVTDAGEQVLRAGMAAGFPAGRPDGHHLINRSDRDALYPEVGTDSPKDMAVYSDIDMEMRPLPEGGHHYVHKDGTPY